MIGLLIGAGILGTIIAAMEKEEFPGWFPMIVCVLIATIPSAIINSLLPPYLFIVGLAVGAVLATIAISKLCGMSVKRASIAVAIYFAIQVVISLALSIALS